MRRRVGGAKEKVPTACNLPPPTLFESMSEGNNSAIHLVWRMRRDAKERGMHGGCAEGWNYENVAEQLKCV